ncbi:DUF6221 family protein [Kitasatospora sp. NPDC058444]|uniref:DUF6221 family protein n=1 Tax=Kitasatospora sp. NPDC058444 TaxID=3346504 RepID=UPI00364EE818
MNTDLDALAEFLSARIADDETIARDAGGRSWEWRHRGTGELWHPEPGAYLAGGGEYLGIGGNRHGGATLCGVTMTPHTDAVHIAHHDPARALADVAAKRRIIDRYTSAVADAAEDADGYFDENRAEDARHLRPVLRLLALPYRDHPDYQPEWAPADA